MFVPFAVETTSVFGPLRQAFLKDISCRVFLATEHRQDKKQTLNIKVKSALMFYHLTQCVSGTIQRGNAASMMEHQGTFNFYVQCLFFVLSAFCFNYFKLFLIRNCFV